MYSVPDDRDYYTFPNNAVDVQGTLTYTVQRYESRAAGASRDCRTVVPVDCRISSYIPQNSRAGGSSSSGYGLVAYGEVTYQ